MKLFGHTSAILIMNRRTEAGAHRYEVGGAGFAFVGAALLYTVGFRGALVALAILLVLSLGLAVLGLPQGLGRVAGKPKFTITERDLTPNLRICQSTRSRKL